MRVLVGVRVCAITATGARAGAPTCVCEGAHVCA